jgi:hypothetical protein
MDMGANAAFGVDTEDVFYTQKMLIHSSLLAGAFCFQSRAKQTIQIRLLRI